jgi:hypothetical protein
MNPGLKLNVMKIIAYNLPNTLPPSPLCSTPHLRPQLSPHQTKSAFHLCPHLGHAALNGLTSKGTLSSLLLDRSSNWPRPRSQWWHVPPIHHPVLLRHPPSPSFVPLCLRWKIVMCTRKNSNWRCLITRHDSNMTVFRPQASGIQFQFSRTWSSQSGGMLMTFGLE